MSDESLGRVDIVRRQLRKLFVTTAWSLSNLRCLWQVVIECIALAPGTLSASVNRIELEIHFADISAIGLKELMYRHLCLL